MSARAWTFQRGVLWAMDLASAAPVPVRPRLAVRFAEISRESLEPLARAMDAHDLPQLALRFGTGRRCFVGWLDDEIVTYGWLSQRDEGVGELERTYRLRPGDRYIWNCATVPSQRGQNLYSALLAAITSLLQAEGAQCVWIGANLENTPSLRAFARVGFLPVVQVTYARLLFLSALWIHPQPRAPRELVIAARQMLIAPHERAWRSLALGVRAGRAEALAA